MIVIMPADVAAPSMDHLDAERPDRLIAAAIEVFVEQGYEGARVQDIARAAGLTTGAIYANFRGKGELLFDAIGARAGVEVDALLAEARGREARELLEHARRPAAAAARAGRRCLLDAIAAARRDPELAERAARTRLGTREARARRAGRARARPTARSIPTLDHRRVRALLLDARDGCARAAHARRRRRPTATTWHALIPRLLDAVVPRRRRST